MAKKKLQLTDHSQCQKRVTELEHSLKRAWADFDNLQKRVDKERTEMALVAKVKLLQGLLPIIDNFSRATSHLPDQIKNNGWAIGILAIHRQFDETLKQLGLESIEVKPGDAFDPKLHEAISHEPHDSIQADRVIEPVSAGYCINGQVLRVAKVRVSSGSAPDSLDRNVKYSLQ